MQPILTTGPGKEIEEPNSRTKILCAIRDKDYYSLFMEVGCSLYALVLHENLDLPLRYASSRGRDLGHVFVLRDGLCLDYEGESAQADIMKKYSGWPNVEPSIATAQEIKTSMQERGIEPELQEKMITIARTEFEARKQLYVAVATPRNSISKRPTLNPIYIRSSI
jgi:hypothetical protein